MNELVHVTQSGGLAWVTIDNPPVNATSAAVRRGLEEAVAHVARLPVRAAVLRCAGRTFVAGGDITEFDAPPVPPDLPDVVRLIEDCPVPWIAALHGSVFGGGLEIALGCAWRVAVPGTRLALPEVTLGIVPGAGGTQRLPRLVGLEMTLPMATGGAPVSAEAFLDAGGLDAILPNLNDASLVAFAQGCGERPSPTRSRDVAPMPPEWWAAEKVRVAASAGGAIAPLANLELVALAAELPFYVGQPKERTRHLELRVAPQSRALRHLFLAERQAARAPVAPPSQRPSLSSVVVLGHDALADRLAAALERAGLTVSRRVGPESPPSVIVLTGQDDANVPASGDVPILRAAGLAQGATLSAGPSGVVLGVAPAGIGVMEIATSSDAAPEAAALSVALAKRLGLAPVFSTPKDAFLTARLSAAVARYLDASRRDANGIAADLLRAADAAALTPAPEDDAAPPVQRLLAVLVNEGALALEDGCARDAGAIDVICCNALGFPRWRGGPMHYAETTGTARVSHWMGDVMENMPGAWRLSDMLRRVRA